MDNEQTRAASIAHARDLQANEDLRAKLAADGDPIPDGTITPPDSDDPGWDDLLAVIAERDGREAVEKIKRDAAEAGVSVGNWMYGVFRTAGLFEGK